MHTTTIHCNRLNTKDSLKLFQGYQQQQQQQQRRRRSQRSVCVCSARSTPTTTTDAAFLASAAQRLTPGQRSLIQVAEPVPLSTRLLPRFAHPAASPGGMAAVAAAAVAAAAAIAGVARFATADRDVRMLFRGRHKRDAFDGAVVWVTGASQGLGAELARYLSKAGARLVISSRSRARLEEVKASCEGKHATDIVVLPLDVTGPPRALEAAAAAADAAFGGAGVDYLVHNAGASQHALAAETAHDVADALVALNALAPIHLTRAALPRMLERRKGRIVVVASMAARVPSPGQAVYAGAKAALWGYFGSLAAEVADSGVGVTIVCPGPISTGAPSAPRVIYGPAGLATHAAGGGGGGGGSAKGRVTPERCAALIADAMAHGLDEAWIARHPVLLVGYLMQYAPALGWALMKRIGPGRARAVSEGRNGYDAGALLRGGGNGGGGGSAAAASAAATASGKS